MAVDPGLPLMDVTTHDDAVERRFSQERLYARAYALFGSLALGPGRDRPVRRRDLDAVAILS